MAYLGNTGLTKLVELINEKFATVADLAANNKNTNRTIEFIKTTNTAANAALTGVSEDSSLYDGKTIFLFLTYAAGSNATLNLTLSNGTTTGAKPLYYTGTSRMTTHYSAGSVVSLTYVASEDGWRRADYVNSNTYDRTLYNNAVKAASAVTAKAIIVGDSGGYKNAVANATFDISYPILYASAAIAANATATTTYVTMPGVAMTTNKSGWTGTQYAMAYLVGTLSGKTFTIDSSVFTTTVPTAEDGKAYIPLGICITTTTIYFYPQHEVYEYKNGAFGMRGGDVTITTGSANGTISVNGTDVAVKNINTAAYKADTYFAQASHGNHVPAVESANNAKFLRNDNTWQTVTPANIGALSASGTAADSNKLGGTAASSYALKTYVDNKVADLVNSAPETLDTLDELANALGDDPNFATTVATQIGGKSPLGHTHVGTEVTLTGYSKASSASAVAATDTVNAAIGKLEKALDGKQASGSYLTAHQTIKQDAITGATVNRYGSCSTAAGTAAKAVSVTAGTVSLEAGLKVTVKFANANTANSPTLNVNNKGAKNIFHKGAQITSGANKALLAGVCDFVYDGTQFHLVGNYVDTTYSTATTSAAGLMSADDKTKLNGIATGANAYTHPNDGANTGSFGPSADASPAHGGTFSVPYVTVNAAGHVTEASTKTITLPVAPTSVTSATKLSTARAIDGVNFDGSAAITHYGTCSTAAGTAAKTVACTSYTLATGSRIIVKFTVTNTAANPTLNVNSTGAKAIQYRGAAITAGYLAANRTYEFVYDGTNYQLIGDIDTNTTYTHPSDGANTGSFGPSANASPAHGAGFSVPYITVNAAGHVTAASTKTITLPTDNDTKNTAGSTNSTSKLFLIGATSQAANPQTYSHSGVYATNGTLTATGFSGPLTGNVTGNLTGTASKATADASGNTITTTYATKTEIADVNKNTNRSIEYIIGTQTADTPSFTGVSEDDSLYDGKCINYYLPFAGTSAGDTLNLTLADGTTTGAKQIYLIGTTKLTTHFGAGQIFMMTYSATKDAWYVGEYYVANSNNYDRNLHNDNIKAVSAIAKNQIIVGDAAGYKKAAAGVTFDITYPIMFASAAIAANAAAKTAYEVYPSVPVTTTVANWTGTQYAMMFMVGTLSGTTFTIDSSVFTTTVPASADGKVYIPIGICPTTTTVNFYPQNEFFEYKDGTFRPYNLTAYSTMTATEATTGTSMDGKLISPKVLADYVAANAGGTGTYYGTCSTAASTAAKVVTCADFTSLTTGASISVKFTVTNTASSPTLNVNSTGAKAIYYHDANVGANKILAYTVYNFVYDGTYWQLIDTAYPLYYGTCSTAAGTTAKVVSCAGFALVTGAEITVKFTVTNTAASPTLNVNSTGAKAIYYKGAAITAGYLAANKIYKFVYDGSYWQLVGDVDTNTTYTAMTQSVATAGTSTDANTISAKVLNDTIDAKINAIEIADYKDY